MGMATVAKIAVENTAYSFDMLFDYSVPSSLINEIEAGKRVLIPFGNTSKKRVGVVFAVTSVEDIDKKLKSISCILDDEPLLTREMLLTANFIHDKCFCTYFDSCRMFLPLGMSMDVKVLYACNSDYKTETLDSDELKVFEYLKNKNTFVNADTIIKDCKLKKSTGLLDSMSEKGALLRSVDAHRRVGDATLKMVRLAVDPERDAEAISKLTKKQKEIIKVLNDVGSASIREICYFTGFTAAVISALENKGIVEVYVDEIYRNPYVVEGQYKRDIVLSKQQNDAYTGLCELLFSNKPEAALLYGVTGSGKTQVYLKLIDKALETSKGIIVMIPEISLTPQILSVFHERYGEKVAVFHSALSLGERLDEWKRIKRGEAQIAVGTRSAVFAPFDEIGLIIIDEEQEHTYKSEMSPRFHARDVAGFRISKNNGLLVLASATPSIDSFTKAQNGFYSYFELNERYGNAVLPNVEIIDTTYQSDMVLENISKRLADELIENYNNKKQSILLLNRRGYNTYASCTECGTVMSCPNCSISLTYHIKNGRLMCHYCGYSVPFTHTCSNCGTDAMKFTGTGTQKLEEELKMIVPDARILRMDTDTTASRYSYDEKFGKFGNGEYDILVGTQMVAKGLNFPNVTLVGVLNIDQMLFNDDYKSGERAFDLITQVVGRSGRGDFPGKAFIQTSFPDSEIVTLAKEQDYKSFYNLELPIRKEMTYPPFCDLCVIGFSGEKEARVMFAATEFLNKLKEIHSQAYSDEKIIVLGPVTPRVAKIGGKYRARIIIKCRDSKRFREMIGNLLKQNEKNSKIKDVSLYAELNPENVMWGYNGY